MKKYLTGLLLLAAAAAPLAAQATAVTTNTTAATVTNTAAAPVTNTPATSAAATTPVTPATQGGSAFIDRLSVGLTLGWGFCLNPPKYLPGVDAFNGGFQFEIKALYRLVDKFIFKGSTLSVGVLSGWMMVNKYDDGTEHRRAVIPLAGVAQLNLGPVYALAGYGFDFWTADGTGVDSGFVWGGGYLLKLSKNLSLDFGGRIHTIFEPNSLMFAINVGAVWNF